jgi:hypothetical protein
MSRLWRLVTGATAVKAKLLAQHGPASYDDDTARTKDPHDLTLPASAGREPKTLVSVGGGR